VPKYAVRLCLGIDVEDTTDITNLPLIEREMFKQELAKKALSQIYLKYLHDDSWPEQLEIDDVWKFA